MSYLIESTKMVVARSLQVFAGQKNGTLRTLVESKPHVLTLENGA